MQKNLFVIALCLLGLTACQNEAADTKSTDTSGMEKTASGYAYELHRDEEGDPPATGFMTVFDLKQRFDDTLVYSSTERGRKERIVMPTQASMRGKPSPVIEMLQMLSAGDSASLYIPFDSLGPNREPWQEQRDYLIYEISVSHITDLKEAENTAATATADLLAGYKAGTLENLQTTDNGLKYVIVEEGNGPKAEKGKVVSVDYYGVTVADGNAFDNSYKRGEAHRFPLGMGRVIKGWDQGIEGMAQGTKAALFIPADLGYGASGSPPKIPADAELMFYIDVKEVE